MWITAIPACITPPAVGVTALADCAIPPVMAVRYLPGGMSQLAGGVLHLEIGMTRIPMEVMQAGMGVSPLAGGMCHLPGGELRVRIGEAQTSAEPMPPGVGVAPMKRGMCCLAARKARIPAGAGALGSGALRRGSRAGGESRRRLSEIRRVLCLQVLLVLLEVFVCHAAHKTGELPARSAPGWTRGHVPAAQRVNLELRESRL